MRRPQKKSKAKPTVAAVQQHEQKTVALVHPDRVLRDSMPVTKEDIASMMSTQLGELMERFEANRRSDRQGDRRGR